jgi:hypothetical protein
LTEQRAASFRDVVGVGEFRALWLANAQSRLGDQLARVAIAVLVFRQTSSPLLTALTYALTFLPPLVTAPLLVGLADRYPRRTVLVVTDLCRASLVGVMAIPAVSLAGIAPLLVATVSLQPLYSAARNAMLPSVLEGDRYTIGLGLANITDSIAQVSGFAFGGMMVVLVGSRGALGIDALTFVLSGCSSGSEPAPTDRSRPLASTPGRNRQPGAAARLCACLADLGRCPLADSCIAGVAVWVLHRARRGRCALCPPARTGRRGGRAADGRRSHRPGHRSGPDMPGAASGPAAADGAACGTDRSTSDAERRASHGALIHVPVGAYREPELVRDPRPSRVHSGNPRSPARTGGRAGGGPGWRQRRAWASFWAAPSPAS